MHRHVALLLAAILCIALVSCGGDSGTVVDEINADFTASPESPDTGQEVTFDGSLSESDFGEINSYTWFFGDGTSANGQVVTHTYDTQGVFSVDLDVADDQGNTDITGKTIVVGAGANADFTVNPSVPSRNVITILDASPSAASLGQLESYTWEINGQEISTEEVTSHVFTNSGTQNITLTVEDEFGNTDSLTQEVEVSETSGAPGVISGDATGSLHGYVDPGQSAPSNLWTNDHGTEITALSGTGSMPVYMGDANGDVYEVSPGGDTTLFYDGHDQPITSFAFDTEAGFVYIGSENGQIHKVDLQSGSQEWTSQTHVDAEGGVTDLEVGPEGWLFTTGFVTPDDSSLESGRLYKVDPANGDTVGNFGFTQDISMPSLLVDNSTNRILTGQFWPSSSINFIWGWGGTGSTDLFSTGTQENQDGFLAAMEGFDDGSFVYSEGSSLTRWTITDAGSSSSEMSFNEVWSYGQHGSQVRDIHIPDGSTEVMFTASDDQTVHKVQDDQGSASQAWSYTEHGEAVQGVTEATVEPITLTLTDQLGEGQVWANGFEMPPGSSLVVSEGDTITLEAEPGQGRVFGGWSSNVADPGSTETSITIGDASASISVDFPEQKQLTLDQMTGQGTVEIGGQQVSEGDSVTIQEGDSTTISAIPDSGWGFGSWSNNVDAPNNASTSITITEDTNISVTFLEQFDLTLSNVEGQGVVDVSTVTMEEGDSFSFLDGTLLLLEAIPDDGWMFDSWSNNVDEPNSVTTSLTVTQDISISVTFTDGSIQMAGQSSSSSGPELTVGEVHGPGYVQAEGQILHEGDSATFSTGQQVGLSAVPTQQASFVQWGKNVTSPDNRHTNISMNGDQTVSVLFGGVTGRSIYTASENRIVRGMDSMGSTLWSHSHDTVPRDMAMDSDGNVFVAEGGAGGSAVTRYSADGTPLWTYSGHTGPVQAVTVGPNGHIYSGGRDQEVHRIDDNGNRVWTYKTGDRVTSLVTDQDGSVLIGTKDTLTSTTLQKIDSEGRLVWNKDLSESVTSLATGPAGNYYVGTEQGVIHKVLPDRETYWKKVVHSSEVRGMSVDSRGYLYTVSWDGLLLKFGPAGDIRGRHTLEGDSLEDVSVDPEGHLYVATREGSQSKVIRLHAGALEKGPVWSSTVPSDHLTDIVAAPGPVGAGRMERSDYWSRAATEGPEQADRLVETITTRDGRLVHVGLSNTVTGSKGSFGDLLLVEQNRAGHILRTRTFEQKETNLRFRVREAFRDGHSLVVTGAHDAASAGQERKLFAATINTRTLDVKEKHLQKYPSNGFVPESIFSGEFFGGAVSPASDPVTEEKMEQAVPHAGTDFTYVFTGTVTLVDSGEEYLYLQYRDSSFRVVDQNVLSITPGDDRGLSVDVQKTSGGMVLSAAGTGPSGGIYLQKHFVKGTTRAYEVGAPGTRITNVTSDPTASGPTVLLHGMIDDGTGEKRQFLVNADADGVLPGTAHIAGNMTSDNASSHSLDMALQSHDGTHTAGLLGRVKRGDATFDYALLEVPLPLAGEDKQSLYHRYFGGQANEGSSAGLVSIESNSFAVVGYTGSSIQQTNLGTTGMIARTGPQGILWSGENEDQPAEGDGHIQVTDATTSWTVPANPEALMGNTQFQNMQSVHEVVPPESEFISDFEIQNPDLITPFWSRENTGE